MDGKKHVDNFDDQTEATGATVPDDAGSEFGEWEPPGLGNGEEVTQLGKRDGNQTVFGIYSELYLGAPLRYPISLCRVFISFLIDCLYHF